MPSFGAKKNPEESLISNIAKELDGFVAATIALKEKTVFDEKGDPRQNGINVELARTYAVKTQDAIDNFKHALAEIGPYLMKNNHETVDRMAVTTRDVKYTPAYKSDVKSGTAMLQETADKALDLATTLRISIGEIKPEKSKGGLSASLGGLLKKNFPYTAADVSHADQMIGALKQNEAAASAILAPVAPTTPGPVNPYGANPAPQQPVNPYAKPQASLTLANPRVASAPAIANTL